MGDRTAAVVALLPDDADNLLALRYAAERWGVERLVVRPASRAQEAAFAELGAFGHDYLADFRFTRTMHGFGLIDGDENIQRILALQPEEYLAALDRRE